MATRGLASLSALALLRSVTGCTALVGDYRTEPPADAVIDTEPLCALERHAFVFEIDLEAHDHRSDLAAYYEAENSGLMAHFTRLERAHRDGEPSRGVTYLTGSAGIGKSFVLRRILSAFAESEQCSFTVSELLAEQAEELPFPVDLEPDLASLNGQTVFNRLPSCSKPASLELSDLLELGGCLTDGSVMPLVVIDGIDEVHSTTAALILEQVDRYLDGSSTGDPAFIHFLIAGRPEGFATWLTDPERTGDNQDKLDRFDLKAPRFRTAGDLEFRLRDALGFSGELEQLEAEGRFDDYLESLTRTIVAQPFLTYSLGNLAVGNVIIEHAAPGLDEDEEQLKAGLFDDILLRNGQTHGRPGTGSELDGVYLRALEDIAARYAVAVDEGGIFTVRAEDTIAIADDEGAPLGTVRVRDVLNRGGVAFLTSATARTTRYRFDPFWLHAHLVERRNQRLGQEHEYRTCN